MGQGVISGIRSCVELGWRCVVVELLAFYVVCVCYLFVPLVS